MKKNNKTTPTNRFSIDPGLALLIGAAAFQAYHMGRAFHVYDPDGWHISGVNIGGFILGAIVNFIVAQAAIRLPAISATFASLKEQLPKVSRKPDKKEEQARSRALKRLTFAMKQNAYSQRGFYMLLAFSVLMIAPALYILWSNTLPFHPLFIALMAVVGAALPDFAITVGGFIADKSLTSLGSVAPATGSDAGSVAQRRPATLKGRSAKDSATLNDAPAKLYRCECGKTFTFEERFKYSGHTRTCEVRKTIKQQVIPADGTPFDKVTKR